MANLNKVLLIGNLTRAPELKYLPSGSTLCEFGMATNRRWKDKNGQQQESVCFVDLTAWGRSGELINQYVSKGDPLFVEGRLDFSSWTDQGGAKRSKLRVVVESFQFLGSKQGGGAAAPPPKDDEGGGHPIAGDSEIPF